MLTSQWFVKRRGRAVAVVVLGIAASNALLPPVTQALISSVGWREAYVALGVMVWVLLIPAAVLIVRNRPEDVGLHPDGAATLVEEPVGGETGEERGFWKVVASPDFWFLAVPLAAVPFVVTALVFHQISILEGRGLTPATAAGVFIPFAAASAAATALSGALAERLGPKGVLMVSLGLLLAAVVGLQFVSTVPTAVAYSVLLGAAAGSQGVVAGMVWAHYYGRAGLGRLQGPATMVMISAAALAPLPLAAFHHLSGDYSLGLLVMAAIPIACAIMARLFDPERARRDAETVEA
jgi:MFS family permease